MKEFDPETTRKISLIGPCFIGFVGALLALALSSYADEPQTNTNTIDELDIAVSEETAIVPKIDPIQIQTQEVQDKNCVTIGYGPDNLFQASFELERPQQYDKLMINGAEPKPPYIVHKDDRICIRSTSTPTPTKIIESSFHPSGKAHPRSYSGFSGQRKF